MLEDLVKMNRRLWFGCMKLEELLSESMITQAILQYFIFGFLLATTMLTSGC